MRNQPTMTPYAGTPMNGSYQYSPSTPYGPTYGYLPQQGFKPPIMTNNNLGSGYGPGLVYGPYQVGPTGGPGFGFNPTSPFVTPGYNQYSVYGQPALYNQSLNSPYTAPNPYQSYGYSQTPYPINVTPYGF